MQVLDEEKAIEGLDWALELIPEKLGELAEEAPQMAMLLPRVAPTLEPELEGFHDVAFAMMPAPMVIGVRDGCFCAHIVVRELINVHPIRTWIGAVGLHLAPEFFRMILPGVVRASLGLENDERDVDALLEALAEVSSAARSWPNRVIASTHNGTWMLPQTGAEDQIAAYAADCVEKVYS